MRKLTFTCLYCNTYYSGPVPGNHYGKYCNTVCATKGRSRDKLNERIELLKEGKLQRRDAIYKALVAIRGDNCACCGISEWNGKPLRLWVDHIDGNATNNSLENLQLVCPNCDSQSAHFMARNKGNGRGSLGLKKWA